jgi:hypothetical protein
MITMNMGIIELSGKLEAAAGAGHIVKAGGYSISPWYDKSNQQT